MIAVNRQNDLAFCRIAGATKGKVILLNQIVTSKYQLQAWMGAIDLM